LLENSFAIWASYFTTGIVNIHVSAPPGTEGKQMARPTRDIHALTPREREVLALIGEGRTTKEIAAQLKVSPETVGNHRKNICRKLGAHSTAELASLGAKLSESYEN